jgi:hypothetical protein
LFTWIIQNDAENNSSWWVNVFYHCECGVLYCIISECGLLYILEVKLRIDGVQLDFENVFLRTVLQ